MLVRTTTFAMLILCVIGENAHAQDAATTGIAYTDATRDARRMAPSIGVGRARSNVSAAEVDVARALVNPIATVGTTFSGPRFFSSLSIPLPITRRQRAIAAAQSTADAVAAEVPVMELDAELATADAWCDLWLAERTLDVARENENRAASLLDVAEQRVKAGTAPRVDAARATAEYARNHAEMIARTELIAGASAALAYWLGRDPEQIMHAAPMLPEPSPLPPLEALTGRLSGHPLNARNAAKARAAVAGVEVQRSLVWPAFGVQVGTTLSDRYPPPTNNVSAGLVFDLPVFNWNGAGVAEAQRAVAEAHAESRVSVAQLQSELVSAYSAARAAIARAEGAEKESLPAAKIAADLTRDAYSAGAVDLSAVLVAEKALSDARQVAFESIAQRARALAALEHALGAAL